MAYDIAIQTYLVQMGNQIGPQGGGSIEYTLPTTIVPVTVRRSSVQHAELVESNIYMLCTGRSTDNPPIELYLEIRFYQSGTTIPTNETRVRTSSDKISIEAVIHTGVETYPWYVDAVRNENCKAYIDDNNTWENSIYVESKVGWGHEILTP